MNIWKILKGAYKALLSGRTLKVGKGSITFPDKGHEVPHENPTSLTPPR